MLHFSSDGLACRRATRASEYNKVLLCFVKEQTNTETRYRKRDGIIDSIGLMGFFNGAGLSHRIAV